MRGLRLNLWRPPTQNDRADRNGAAAWEGLERLKFQRFRVRTQKQLPTDSSHLMIIEFVMDYNLLTPDGDAMPLREIFEIASDGAMQVSVRLQGEGVFKTFARVGLQGKIPKSYSTTTWWGYDAERYPDRRTAGEEGRFRVFDLASLARHHAVPQEEGNREAWQVEFSDYNRGRSLTVSIDQKELFNFSRHSYDDTVVAAHDRWWKMPAPDSSWSIFNIDSRLAGVGTATCGPGVRERYLLSGDSTYTFRFSFFPSEVADSNLNVRGNPFVENKMLSEPLKRVERANLAKSLKASRKPSGKYGKGFPGVLHDGRHGVAGDWGSGWVGWEGAESVVLEVKTKKRGATNVAVSFGHAPDDWVMMPEKVEVWVPKQKAWVPLTIVNRVKDPRHGRQRVTFALKESGVKIQKSKLKIRITGVGRLPEWHAYKGEKAWLMVDEIRVTCDL